MHKTILITGATDGIGLETAKMLVSQGHHVLLHGRNPGKLNKLEKRLSDLFAGARIESFVADFSRIDEVAGLADAVAQRHARLDVLINNAGIFKTPAPFTPDGLDVRFLVNTIAPYLLTKRLLPLLDGSGRVVNLSSAAQSSVDLAALAGRVRLSQDFEAYAQSKLAITMWSRAMALSLGEDGPVVVAVNPGSLLGTKMVKQAFDMEGHDIRIGADILCRAALSVAFEQASGKYFDNDARQFADPNPDALDARKCGEVVRVMETFLASN